MQSVKRLEIHAAVKNFRIVSEPNAVMFVNPKIAKPSIFDVTKKTWSNEDFDGWVRL